MEEKTQAGPKNFHGNVFEHGGELGAAVGAGKGQTHRMVQGAASDGALFAYGLQKARSAASTARPSRAAPMASAL
jgi:hypothetical protein